MGRDPLVVEGPGERSEPLDELGWLPPGEMVGLELLRLNRRMAAGWSRQADGQASRRGVQAEAEERSSAGGAPAEQREIRFGRQARSVEARRSDPRSSVERAQSSWRTSLSAASCRAGAGGS